MLIVCTANICRSPMAEGLLRSELQRLGLQRKVKVDSAGTHAAQPGRLVDQRAVSVCRHHGIDIRKARARQVRGSDFNRFDFILAMDGRNLEWLINNGPEAHRHKVSMLGSWPFSDFAIDIPDPYYGNAEGFEHVFELMHAPINCLTATLIERLGS